MLDNHYSILIDKHNRLFEYTWYDSVIKKYNSVLANFCIVSFQKYIAILHLRITNIHSIFSILDENANTRNDETFTNDLSDAIVLYRKIKGIFKLYSYQHSLIQLYLIYIS